MSIICKTMSAVNVKVFIASEVPNLCAILQKQAPNIVAINVGLNDEGGVSDEGLAEMKDAEIILADPPVIARAVYELPKLKYAQSTWAGLESMFSKLDKSKELPTCLIARQGRIFGPLIAQYVLGNIISRERFFPDLHKDQTEHAWKKEQRKIFRPMEELTLGLLGAGDIGMKIAELCKSVGMTVYGLVSSNNPHQRTRPTCIDKYVTKDNLPELLENSDYVCNILPSTPATQNMLTGDILSHCVKKKSCFINIGRGDIIDDESLIKALKSGWLSGAILDVFQQEPLPENHPFWSQPNIFITPHVSGTSLPQHVTTFFLENLQRYLEKKELLYQVDLNSGY